MYGQLAFLAGLAALTGVLLYWSFSQDRVLGVIVAVSLVLRVAGSVAFTWYLDMQGKEFFSDDEMAYLQTGQLIVAEWQSNVQYEAPSEQVVSLGGGYPLWNAFLIWLWGPSLLPMRLANGLVGTMGVLIAFHLGQHLFPGRLAARAAALLVGLSPSLIVWSLSNLRETFLAVLISATVLGFLSIMRSFGRARFGMFMGCLVCLGFIRSYYAAVLGWLCLMGFLLLPQVPLRYKVLLVVPLTIAIGLALQTVTGTLLALNVPSETMARYVVTDGSDSEVEYLEFPPDPVEVILNLPVVMFGRFESRAGVGQVMTLLLLPEWMATFAIVPLAGCGLRDAMRRRQYDVLLPAAFVCIMLLVLAWMHGDAWTTYRHRASFWPLLLVLAGGGASMLLQGRTVRSSV